MSEPVGLPRSVSSLRDLRGRRRVLLTRSSVVDTTELWAMLQDARFDLEERRIVVLVNDDDGVMWWPQSPPSEVSPDLGPEIDRLLDGAVDRLILIGLDGGVKRRYEAAEFSVTDLFADIDAMPMRRAELGRHGS